MYVFRNFVSSTAHRSRDIIVTHRLLPIKAEHHRGRNGTAGLSLVCLHIFLITPVSIIIPPYIYRLTSRHPRTRFSDASLTMKFSISTILPFALLAINSSRASPIPESAILLPRAGTPIKPQDIKIGMVLMAWPKNLETRCQVNGVSISLVIVLC
jgi:hypothetical protein